jgi:hypothetical protein
MTKLKLKLIKLLLNSLYSNELNNNSNDFEKVFETITDDLKYILKNKI